MTAIEQLTPDQAMILTGGCRRIHSGLRSCRFIEARHKALQRPTRRLIASALHAAPDRVCARTAETTVSCWRASRHLTATAT